MRNLVATLSVVSTLVLAACGGGGDNGNAGKQVVRTEDFTNDYSQVTTAEANMKSYGFEFSSEAGNTVSWERSEFTSMYNSHKNASNAEKIAVLQNYVSSTQTFLDKYSHGPLVLKGSDGSTTDAAAIPEKVYLLQQKIRLANAKMSELQAATPASQPATENSSVFALVRLTLDFMMA